MTPEQLQQEINVKREEMQNFLMEANKQAAWFEGYIAALESLLTEPQPQQEVDNNG